jgi:hypothetical protein
MSGCTCGGVTHVKLMAKVISLSKIGAHGYGLHLRHGYQFWITRFETANHPCRLVYVVTTKRIINRFDVSSLSEVVQKKRALAAAQPGPTKSQPISYEDTSWSPERASVCRRQAAPH